MLQSRQRIGQTGIFQDMCTEHKHIKITMHPTVSALLVCLLIVCDEDTVFN